VAAPAFGIPRGLLIKHSGMRAFACEKNGYDEDMIARKVRETYSLVYSPNLRRPTRISNIIQLMRRIILLLTGSRPWVGPGSNDVHYLLSNKFV
jgi:hypothetical protein